MKRVIIALFMIVLFCLSCTVAPSENATPIYTPDLLATYQAAWEETQVAIMATLEAGQATQRAQIGKLLSTQQVLETQVAQATSDNPTYAWPYNYENLGRLTATNTSSTPGVTQLPINSSQTPWSNKLIGIVAGHSGNDSGAVCSDALGGYREVDINQTIANLVKDNLVAKVQFIDSTWKIIILLFILLLITVVYLYRVYRQKP